jgi:uncharacterized protein DUF6766
VERCNAAINGFSIMKKMLRNNGLSITLFGIFLLAQIGLSFVGQAQYNNERKSHQQSSIGYWEYIESDTFLETTMENWESEFLQMFAYVVLTAFLYQKGSSESKEPGVEEDVDADPRKAKINPDTPWPVKRGGWVLKLYENSLSVAFLILFIISFMLHAVGGAGAYNEEQLRHGETTVSTIEYIGTSQFWFESLQNWQSEFFSIGMMVVLTIVLRQKGSPESKPVAMPHSDSP